MVGKSKSSSNEEYQKFIAVSGAAVDFNLEHPVIFNVETNPKMTAFASEEGTNVGLPIISNIPVVQISPNPVPPVTSDIGVGLANQASGFENVQNNQFIVGPQIVTNEGRPNVGTNVKNEPIQPIQVRPVPPTNVINPTPRVSRPKPPSTVPNDFHLRQISQGKNAQSGPSSNTVVTNDRFVNNQPISASSNIARVSPELVTSDGVNPVPITNQHFTNRVNLDPNLGGGDHRIQADDMSQTLQKPQKTGSGQRQNVENSPKEHQNRSNFEIFTGESTIKVASHNDQGTSNRNDKSTQINGNENTAQGQEIHRIGTVTRLEPQLGKPRTGSHQNINESFGQPETLNDNKPSEIQFENKSEQNLQSVAPRNNQTTMVGEKNIHLSTHIQVNKDEKNVQGDGSARNQQRRANIVHPQLTNVAQISNPPSS